MARRRTAAGARASVVTRERVYQYLRSQYSALANLTPERLRSEHAAWDAGYLRAFASTQEQLVDRDDMLKSVAGKRIKAASIRSYEILTTEDSPSAALHKEALEEFYNGITVTNAIDENERGGAAMLFRSQMSAVGFRYAVHEIVWQPAMSGLTAEIRYTPLAFFENTTGRLRFLPGVGALTGADLEPGRWIVTVGEHLMKACSIAYIYKHMPLRDWLIYCSRHGMPGIAGKTDAQKGSEEWRMMESAVRDFSAEFSAVMSAGSSIEPIDLGGAGEIPYPKLVERMDRVMSSLWRGADLSTISAASGTVGASLQRDEMQVLEASDAMMLSEALQIYLDPWVIRYQLGAERPLAYISVKTASRRNTEIDLRVDRELYDMGYPITLRALSETYSRPLPEGSPDVLATQAERQKTRDPDAGQSALTAANAAAGAPGAPAPVMAFIAAAKEALPRAIANDLRPVAERLIAIYRMADHDDLDDDELRELLRLFRDNELPTLAAGILADASAPGALMEIMSGAFALGVEQGAEAAQ